MKYINKLQTFVTTPPNLTKTLLQTEKFKPILTEKAIKTFKIEKTKALKVLSVSINNVKNLTKTLIKKTPKRFKSSQKNPLFAIQSKKTLEVKRVSFNILNRLICKSLPEKIEENKFDCLRSKVLKALHDYTGYSVVNIYGKPIELTSPFKLEIFYNKELALLNFMKRKFLRSSKASYSFNIKAIRLFKRKTRFRIFRAGRIRDILPKFLEGFPFYVLKLYKPFFIRLVNLLVLRNYDMDYKHKIIKESFKYLYFINNCHFFNAFKIYKMLLMRVFKFNLLNITGIQIVAKGRFGKVRKQIAKLSIGKLKLNTFNQKINYFSDHLVTPRGSYGFHMWFGEKEKAAAPTSRSSLKKRKKK